MLLQEGHTVCCVNLQLMDSLASDAHFVGDLLKGAPSWAFKLTEKLDVVLVTLDSREIPLTIAFAPRALRGPRRLITPANRARILACGDT